MIIFRPIVLLTMLNIISLSFYTQIPQDQLTVFYPMYTDPASTLEVAPNVVGFNDAIWVGNVQPTLDRFGNENCALQFDGSPTTLLLVQTSSAFDPGSDDNFSISLWMKGGSLAAGDLEILLKRQGDSGDNVDSYNIGLYDLNKPLMFTDESSLWANDNEIAFPPNEDWYHIVGVFESGNWKMYINNNSDVSQTPYGPQTTLSTYFDVIIGENFEGTLDDIAFYKKALTADEITALYNAESSCGVLGIDNNLDTSHLEIFPNPANGIIQITLDKIDLDYIEIYNELGQIIYTESINPFEDLSFDVSIFPAGKYEAKFYRNEEVKLSRSIIFMR